MNRTQLGKKYAVFAIALLLCASGFIASAVSSNGNAFTTVIEAGSMVDDASYIVFKDGTNTLARNGTTGAIDYSSSNATSVIQSALNGGGLVLVKPGTYELTMQGATNYAYGLQMVVSNTVLMGYGGEVILKLSDDAARNGTYDSIIMMGDGTNAYHHLSVDGITIDGNLGAQDGKTIGIGMVRHITNSSVKNCAIFDVNSTNNGAIYLITCEGPNVIQSNTITNNARCSIYVENSDRLKVLDNICAYNGKEIYIGYSSDVVVSGNQGIGATMALGHGIYLSHDDNVTVTGNNFMNNHDAGVRLADNTNVVVDSNVISGNNIFGICAQSSTMGSGLTISNNVLRDNHGADAINLYKYSNAQITGNYIYNNEYSGIGISGDSDNVVVDSNVIINAGTLLTNTYYGIYVTTSSDNCVISNNIIDNETGFPQVRIAIWIGSNAGGSQVITSNYLGHFCYHGISADKGDCLISNNIIHLAGLNNEIGINIASGNCSATNNKIIGHGTNTHVGIGVKGWNNAINGNEIKNMPGGFWAIYVTYASYSTFNDNRIYNIVGGGIHIQADGPDSKYSVFNSNVISGCTSTGIYFQDNVNCTLVGNVIYNNGDKGIILDADTVGCIVTDNIVYANTAGNIQNLGANFVSDNH